MGLCACLNKLLRRGKYLFLLLLSLSVLAWIATYASATVRALHDGAVLDQALRKQLAVRFPERPEPDGALDGTAQQKNTEEKVENREVPLERCPQESPLLRGAQKLAFKPSLTLSEVEVENAGVVKGRHQPADCIARQSVAILIPFRNREKHLLYFLHHLHPFLQRQQLHYAIYIIQQAGEATFNRAKLLNVGYLEALKDHSWDCFILHDVDLIPENDRNIYMCDTQPKHLVVGRNSTGYKLRYKGYFGGVTAMTREQFFKVNGFSNTYWGWGGEDDDLRTRVMLQDMVVVRPPEDVARYTMVFHQRDSGNEVNKDRGQLLKRTFRVWRRDGLNTCLYKVLSVERPRLYVNVTVDIGTPPASP